MSPTDYTARMADAEARLETARKAQNVLAMPSILADMTAVIRAYYAAPQAKQ
jgi:hypothetical protein